MSSLDGKSNRSDQDHKSGHDHEFPRMTLAAPTGRGVCSSTNTDTRGDAAGQSATHDVARYGMAGSRHRRWRERESVKGYRCPGPDHSLPYKSGPERGQIERKYWPCNMQTTAPQRVWKNANRP